MKDSNLKWSEYDFTTIPFERIVRVGQRTLLYRKVFNVSWLLGRFCNYRCSYCWPYARSDKIDHRPLPLLINTMDEIKRQAGENGFNAFHFSFSGGEPTLHPKFLNLLGHYSEDSPKRDYQSLHMTSNLSLPLRWFEKYVKATKKLHRVSVTASWHREFARKEELRDKIIFLQENDIHITINIVMVPANFEYCYKEALFFHESGINVTLKPQSNPTASRVVDGYTKENLVAMRKGLPQRDYTAKRMIDKGQTSGRPRPSVALNSEPKERGSIPQRMQVELRDNGGKIWYMDQAERFNAFNFNKFKGWHCNAGFQGIVIREPDGNIKRSYSCHDEPIGHIERGFSLFKEPTPCITPTCVSSVDSKMPKERRW